MLTKFSVRKPFTIFVAVAIVLIFGGVSLSRMTPELFPSLNMPYVLVMTADPGASAEEAEKVPTVPALPVSLPPTSQMEKSCSFSAIREI